MAVDISEKEVVHGRRVLSAAAVLPQGLLSAGVRALLLAR
jgi:hypothetical protein